MRLQKLIVPVLLLTLAVSSMASAQGRGGIKILFKNGLFKGPSSKSRSHGCDSCGCDTGCECDAPPVNVPPVNCGIEPRYDAPPVRSCRTGCCDRTTNTVTCKKVSCAVCRENICLPNLLPGLASRIGNSCKSFARKCPRKICVPVFHIRNISCSKNHVTPCRSKCCSKGNCDSYWEGEEPVLERSLRFDDSDSHIYDTESPFKDDVDVPPLPPTARRNPRMRLRS